VELLHPYLVPGLQPHYRHIGALRVPEITVLLCHSGVGHLIVMHESDEGQSLTVQVHGEGEHVKAGPRCREHSRVVVLRLPFVQENLVVDDDVARMFKLL